MHPNRQPRAPQCVDWSEQLGKVKPAARAIGLFRSTEIGHIKGMVHAGHHTQQAHGDADAGDGENGAAPVPPAVLEHQREIAEHNKEHYSNVECTTGLPACRPEVRGAGDTNNLFAIVEKSLMRSFRKILLRGCLALACLTASIYGGEDLWVRFRGRPVEHVKVDRVYAAMNRWNEVEYSVGTPVMETCIDALMPHLGYVPCWYLRRHTFQQVGNP
jgi:hypothetical protein